jgi:Protein kinase domain
MADVVLAEDMVLGRYVALKRVRTANDVALLKRVRREATLGASIDHPNLVRIYDVHEKHGDAVIVMEYVAGDTLHYLIRTRGAVRVPKALSILAGVASALDAVHAHGAVHRDVKPANILLGVDGSVKLADLGIAAVDDHTDITTAGQAIGTFSYMAPEQLQGGAPQPSMDVYALAALAFETLCGQKARAEPNPVALAYAISNRPPPDLREYLPRVPDAAASVLKSGMASDPSLRPRTAGELVGRLREALVPETTEELPPYEKAAEPAALPIGNRWVVPPPARTRTKVGRRRHRRSSLVLAAFAVAALMATAVGIATMPSGDKSHRSHIATASPRARRPMGRAARHRHRPAPPAPGATAAGPQHAASNGATPSATVQMFYEAAARHDYRRAWKLADTNVRNQLEGFASFRAQMSRVRVITFHQTQAVREGSGSAIVALATTAELVDRTQRCNGTVATVRIADGSWLLDHISINCIPE